MVGQGSCCSSLAGAGPQLRKGQAPTQYLISHELLVVDGYKVIYFVISLIFRSKADLVSKLYSFLHSINLLGLID